MSPKNPKSPKDEKVLTPGGPRSRDLVHAVTGGQAVEGGSGTPRIIRMKKSSAFAAGVAAAQGLVLTPGGYRHPSLVHRVEPGHALQFAREQARFVNLSTKAAIEVPRAEVSPDVVPALGSGWIAYAYWNNGTGNSITSFKTTWKVPPPPKTDSGQTIFLFNGIQNYGTNFGILQPVLQWGPSHAGGGSYWTIASWYVTSGGSAFFTPLIQVNPGDLLTGVMSLAGQSGGLFSYTSAFQGIAGTSLPVQNIAELLWCNETLEAYNLNACSDYPNADFTAFYDIAIQTGATTPTLDWTAVDAVTDCGQYAVVDSNSATNGRVDIHYRPSIRRYQQTEYLIVRDIILLWLYRHGWEDPGWGGDVFGQIATLTGIYEFANEIGDKAVREQIRRLAGEALKGVAKEVEQE